MLGLKLNHVSKRGHWWHQTITSTISHQNGKVLYTQIQNLFLIWSLLISYNSSKWLTFPRRQCLSLISSCPWEALRPQQLAGLHSWHRLLITDYCEMDFHYSILSHKFESHFPDVCSCKSNSWILVQNAWKRGYSNWVPQTKFTCKRPWAQWVITDDKKMFAENPGFPSSEITHQTDEN